MSKEIRRFKGTGNKARFNDEDTSDPYIFPLSTQTYRLDKHPVDDEGNIIREGFNARTYTNKAHKAFLAKKPHFNYKGNVYSTPRIKRSEHIKYLNNLFLEEGEGTDIDDMFETIGADVLAEYNEAILNRVKEDNDNSNDNEDSDEE